MIKGYVRSRHAFVRGGLIGFLGIAVLSSTTAFAARAGSASALPPVTPFAFSATPSDDEFLRTGLFAEPLAPVLHGDTEDNRDLAKALLAYKSEVEQSGARDAVGPLLRYLDAHPASPWRASLQLNLGMVYRQTGHFSKALAIWQDGWEEAKSSTDEHGKALANAIVARLSQLEAYLGRKELLSPLLDSIKDRPIGGTATQLLTNSREGLYDMTFKPEDSFRCGPLALKRILNHGAQQPSALALKVLDHESPSTDHGLSLNNVKDIAERAGMHYQAAFRSPGAPVIYPAVAHWNVGHYAALVDKQNDGRYLVQDTTFGEDIRISEATLNEESSGYFLIPQGPLPTGWRTVAQEEGGKIWGRGNTGISKDVRATGPSNSNACNSQGCTAPAVELMVVGLELSDVPVGYHPPLGPDVRFSMYYSHRDMLQPVTFSYTSLGPKWTFNWLSYITFSDTLTGDTYHHTAAVYMQGGGSEPYDFGVDTDVNPGRRIAYGPYTHSFFDDSGHNGAWQITHPDGSYEVYNLYSGVNWYMTAISDAAGNKVTLAYDAQTRITSITDAIGQVTTLTYGNSNPLLVTKITDPFGRTASFNYDGTGHLSSITDVLGITSSYTYGQGSDPDFINTLTTPYGSTTFTYGDVSTNPSLGSTRFLKTTDPMGRTSYIEFNQTVDAGDSSGGALKNTNLVPTGMNTCTDAYFAFRNTFIWDANQYQLATASGGLDYSLAKVIHWAHSSDYINTSRVKESEKEPLENRVWYNYPTQSSGCGSIAFPVSSTDDVTVGASSKPSAIGRVLDDGSTQLYQYQYNSQGNVTQYTDPLGRQWSYAYDANGVDRLSVSNITNGRSDLLETRTYNGIHEPLTIKGANGKTAHYVYNASGQPTKYTDPLGNVTTSTYDGSGRLKSLQGAIAAAKYTFTYDAVSRVASATDPAGSTVQYKYDAADRLTRTTYPDGTTSLSAYTLLDLTSATDRLGQVTRYKFDADRELISVTDPASEVTKLGYNLAGQVNAITDGNGHTTSTVLDAQGRLVSKQYADGTSVSVDYSQSLSLPATVTDALYQTKTYSYAADNAMLNIAYSGSRVATPSVSFTYDPVYPRRASMTDGTGTTTYTYYGASGLGALLTKTVTSPVAGTAISDTLTYSYDGFNRVTGMAVNGVTRSMNFDAIGRAIGASNGLGTFTYGYNDGTARLSSVSSTSGPNLAATYFGPTGDELLQQLTYTTHTGGTTLSQFGYTYNADNLVKSLAVSTPTAQTTNYGYDNANRLTSGLIGTGTPQYQYTYDHASNLTSITPNGTRQSYSYTSTNEIGGATYDSNGSPASLGGKAYKWDAASRIATFSNPSTSTASSFSYDGLGRLVRVVDTHSGAITSDHSYTWCGGMRCLAHDNTQANSPVSTQYFDQGAIIGGTSYYYIKDQLGSVTELVTSTGSVGGQYSYDPYGNRTLVSGISSDVGYAGYFYHNASSLQFALYRAYDSAHARWLNRDPIGEAGGANLYAYVVGNPTSLTDPFGWCPPRANPSMACVLAGICDLPVTEQNPLRTVAVGGLGVGSMFGVGLLAAEGAGALSPGIASTFANGEYTATTVAEDITAYRYSGGVAGQYGRFLTDAATVNQISSPVSASIALNLPLGATAETLNVFTIPAGTTIYTGGIAGGAESALQIFIENSSVLIPK